MPRLLAASISMTSSDTPSAIARQATQVLSGVGVGPRSQLRAFARMRAVVATALVYRDAVARLPRTAARVWTAVTFVTAGLAAPAYLIARPSRGSTWGFSEVVAVPLFFVLAILPIAILLESWAVRQGLL